MISALTAFFIALLVVAAVTPIVRGFAIDVGAVDRPSERRVHERLIPRLGGIALVLAFFAPLLLLFGVETEVAKRFFAEPLHIVGLVVGGLVICGVGVIDDVRGVRAWTKLWAQLLAATVAFACNYRIEGIAVPWLGNLDMGIFALPVTALWIVAVVNAINLIDGLDGLAGGVTFFACVTNFVVGAINHDGLVTLLSASLGGAVLGFLLYNFNPASIFMGDSGSMFLGYVLATTSILGNSVKSSTTVAIVVPLIALGLPLMDTLFAMARRFLERRPLFAPDRGHIHHRLLAMGINHRRAVLILYALSILCATGAVLISMGRNWQVGGALLVLSMAAIGVVRGFGDFQSAINRFRRRERVRTESVERLRGTVPSVLQRIATIREPGDLPGLLQEFAASAALLSIELTGNALDGLSFAWSARGNEGPPGSGHHPVAASYPLSGAGADVHLRFAWTTDQGEVTPDVDILLQLVADACEARLKRSEPVRASKVKAHLRSI